jgi:hypothetical protein
MSSNGGSDPKNYGVEHVQENEALIPMRTSGTFHNVIHEMIASTGGLDYLPRGAGGGWRGRAIWI